jgi:hypothetical protein
LFFFGRRIFNVIINAVSFPVGINTGFREDKKTHPGEEMRLRQQFYNVLFVTAD